MHVDEYRFLITRAHELEAEAAALSRALTIERATWNDLANAIEDADKARLEERQASDARIKELEALVKARARKGWRPGVVFGGGPTDDGRARGFIGLGWKIEIW